MLALKAKGQGNIEEPAVNQIRELLRASDEKDTLCEDLGNAPVWIRRMMRQLFKEIGYAMAR